MADDEGGEVEVSVLVSRARGGDPHASAALLETLYDHLRALARRHLAAERAGHTLSATALVHEAYLKLQAQSQTPSDRAHFLAIASLAMRRVLVSHSRKRRAAKRGSGERVITLDEALIAGAHGTEDILAIEAALERLAALSERQALVITHKAFAAMTDEEIAQVVGVSVPTVRRDLRMAAAFLRREFAP
jgi:RNA polymerase sigma factor (TIGR02999 family)